MLNSIIKFALNHRSIVFLTSVILVFFGLRSASQLSIDVLPDVTRPRVAVLTEIPGFATEDVERLVTQEIELALNGAIGVEAIRSSSDQGLSVIQVEFDWGYDVFRARQIVQERLSIIKNRLPAWAEPRLAPNSTLLGQIMMIGVWSENGNTSPLDLRTIADWTLRRRLIQVEGVAQVLNIGGGKQQFQVLLDPHALHQFDIPINHVTEAIKRSNLNVAAGYVEKSAKELVVRGLGRIRTIEEIEKIVVKPQSPRSVLVEDIGKVVIGHRVKRGDSSVNGYDAVVMTVQKQPDVDTRRLTEEIKIALDSIKKTLPPDVRLEITYQQREFIDYSVKNVVDAIRDGFLFVVVILVVFLLNVRTTVITLTAIPLSLLTTFLVFRWFGLTINVMTLGGIAVALGELVDDAIVDVENIYKRLKQNRNVGKPQSRLQVIFEASSEVRLAIMNSTIIVVMVFVPLFALAGVEGRLFASLGVAYIVSILASTLVSLTVTPVLAYYLLGNYSKVRKHQDPFVLCWLKKLVTPLIQLSLSRSGFILILFVTVFLVLLSVVRVARMGKDFLPPFDEGSAQANLFLPAGASLEASAQVSEIATGKLQKLMKSKDNPDGLIVWLTCRSGRAEEDEHVMGVNGTEITMSLNPDHKISQDDRKKLLQDALDGIPGAELELEQPVAHLINHMISGVAAEIGIKIYGDDLLQLRMKAEKVRDLLRTLDGLANPVIEQQQMVPQLKLEIDPIGLAKYGLTTEQVYRMVETAMQGRVVGRILDGEKQFDLLVRYQEDHRTDLDNLDRMPVETPVGMRLPLSEVASITVATGPNTIKRENARRRIIVRVNTIDRDLVSAVEDIQAKLAAEFKLPADYYYEISGEYEAQIQATRSILVLSLLSLLGMIAVLYLNFASVNQVLQILIAIPIGFVGGVLGLTLTGQTLSIAALVGFVALGGISIRNGILLMESYVKQGVVLGDSRKAIVAGSLDRLSPVTMTTLTTVFALLPLVFAGKMPGREMLYPVATVILAGLVTSALAEYLLRPGLYWHFRRFNAAGSRQDSHAERS